MQRKTAERAVLTTFNLHHARARKSPPSEDSGPFVFRSTAIQNIKRSANCNLRSLPGAEVVTCPKAASWRLLLGRLNCGVFPILKLSARNCSLQRSVNGKSLKSEKSTDLVGGP